MQIVKRGVVAAVTAAMVSGCAGGGGSGSGSATATYADGSTRNLTTQEFLRCAFTFGLACPRSPNQSTTASATGGSSQSGGPSQIQRTPDNTPALPLTTWSERAGWSVKVSGLTSNVTYGQSPLDLSTDESPRRIISTHYWADYWTQDYEHETIVRYDTEGNLMVADQFGSVTNAGLSAVGQPGIDLGVTASDPEFETQSPFTSLKGRAVALMSNPYALGWEYQTFGVWNDGNAEYAVAYAETYGKSTPGAAVPTSGSATFTGKLGGFYNSAKGEGSIVAADIAVSANFSSRTLEFASSGTVLTRDAQTAIAAPELDLRGALNYQSGISTFKGTLSNTGATLSGPTKGRFYGPAAQELGGIFTVQSSTTAETFMGAYGAKR